ncbi:HAMP domain-containing sensor histidine kinase [Sphaerisporangium rubeum]|uniref:sensor histidine kinase n=1 Tax=Sphaerisporangium rubeum TaxID=321317 RepID=UPI0031CFF489
MDQAHVLAAAPQPAEGQECAPSDERRRFATDAAHRLRTPLAGLRAELEEAELHPGETDLYDLVKRALRAVDRLEEAVAELRGIGETTSEGACEQVDLGRLVRQEISRRPDRDRVRLALVPGVTAGACPAELRQVFATLLDGARNRSEETVLVEVRRDGPAAVLTVTAGTSPARAQAFTRLDTAGDGCHLGLSVAHAFARVHDGRLEVHGTASFTLRLPAG